MKLVVAHSSLRRALRSIQRLLVAVAVVALGYCGLTLMHAWNFQRVERRQMEQALMQRRAAVLAAPAEPSAIPDEGLVGRIEIARLRLSDMVVEGTSTNALARAAGHISGTAFPGKPGNVGIAAHRDTFFRPLRNVRANDIITLTTMAGEYRYRVVSTKVVQPEDGSVLNPGVGEVLTLVTCYPFYFVGAAPHRFIVRAERVT